MVLGLSGGLFLAAPLSGLLAGDEVRGTRPLSNPFGRWVDTDQDLLVLGSDMSGANTDVMLTLRVGEGRTTITQVPRDTYINSDRFGPSTANALYAYGGTEAVKQELSDRLGRPIGHYLIIKLGAIRRMGDVLGGVEVDVPKRMYYVDNSQGLYIDLQPGRQTLKGRDLEGRFCAGATMRTATSAVSIARNLCWPHCSPKSSVRRIWFGFPACSRLLAMMSKPISARCRSVA